MGGVEGSTLVIASVVYLASLFVVAELAERGIIRGRFARGRWIYALSLGVYATSWTFFGSVGMADGQGYQFLTIYMGVSLACLLIPILWLPLLRIVRQHRLSSVADLFAFRYRSQACAVLVTLFVVIASIPYLALQIRALTDAARVLTGSREGEWTALAYTGLIAGFALLFGSRHLIGDRQHRGLIVGIALETVVKLIAVLLLGYAAVTRGFGGVSGLLEHARAHPELGRALLEPVGEGSFVTLSGLAFASGFLLPRQFHLAFAERPDDRALLGASWRFPLLLFVFCLAVPPVLWAGQQMAPEADPDTFALHLARSEPWLAVWTYVGGLAASSGMMIVGSVALASMAVNHLLLPWWRPQGELLRTVAWARRGVVLVFMLLGYAFFVLLGREARLASLGLVAFVAMVQLMPGVVGVIAYRGASRVGLFAGLAGGFSMWTLLLALPLVGVSGPAEAVRHWAESIHPSWGEVWTLSSALSLGLNLLLFVAGSLFFPPKEDERVAAEQCGLDVAAGARRLRRPVPAALLQRRLGPLLGERTAARLVEKASRDAGLDPDENASRLQLRVLEENVQAALTGLLGPLLGPAVLDGVSTGASSQLAAQVRFLEERREAPVGSLARVELVRRYLRTVLEELPVGVCALGPADEILVWNRTLGELSGLPGIDWIGHQLDELPPPFAETLAEWSRWDRPAREVPFEHHGEELILRVTGVGLEGGGRVIMLEDLTEHRRLEWQLAHEDRLRSLGRLTAAIGHEVGNPLTGILMLARNLVAEEEPEDLGERLGLIVSEAEKIESIVRSMSAYARAGTKDALAEPSTRPREVVLLEVVEDALRLVRLAKRDHNVLWGYDCAPALAALGDKQQLTQVLVNLLTNACDASQPGQPVRVEARAVSEAWVEVDVIDAGDGMAESVAARIFEPFFTTKDPGAGTGLGLAVSEGIVRAHGGRVEIRTRPGAGTTMRLVLPRAIRAPAPASDAVEPISL